ncbi:MAG: alginate lyase family protein, partial [Blastocatellia bacterium]
IHLTGEALGLFYLGLALPEISRARAWRDLGLRILLEQARKQAPMDGVYFERSPYWRRYTADFYMRLFALTRANDIRLDHASETLLWQKLEATLDHLMWITRPDGTSPLFGGGDDGRLIKGAGRAANDFRDTLAIGAAILKRGDWKHVAGEAPAEMLWLIGPEGVERYDQLRAEPPRENSRGFKPSGYFVMRDGWRRDSSFALIDCGPQDAGTGSERAHSDALSIEFASRGVTWIVAPGAYVYAADAKTRNEFRSTPTRNTVTVDDQPQSLASAPFSRRTAAKCLLHGFTEHDNVIFFQGSHDGYERLKDPVKHTRSVLFVKSDALNNLPEYLIVRDQFNANKRHRYAIRYHLAPGCEARSFGAGRIEARHESGATLTIRVIRETSVKTEVAALSGAEAASGAPVVLFEAEGEGTQEFLTLISPGRLDQVEAVERQILKRWRSGADSLSRRSLEIVK